MSEEATGIDFGSLSGGETANGFSIDLNAVDTTSDFLSIDDGDYPAKITDCVEDVTSKGDKCIVMTFNVNNAGETRYWFNFWNPEPKAVKIAEKDAGRIWQGNNMPGFFQNPSQFVGLDAYVRVVNTEPTEDGKTFSNVVAILEMPEKGGETKN